MTESDGVVVRVEGDYAWVRADGAGNACGACSRKDGCQSSGSLLNAEPGQSVRLLRLANTIQARPGDPVSICIADGMVLRAVWQAYGIPLLLALAGTMTFAALTGSEIASVAGMLAGLLGGYFIMQRKDLASGRTEPILSIRFKRTPLSFHEV